MSTPYDQYKAESKAKSIQKIKLLSPLAKNFLDFQEKQSPILNDINGKQVDYPPKLHAITINESYFKSEPESLPIEKPSVSVKIQRRSYSNNNIFSAHLDVSEILPSQTITFSSYFAKDMAETVKQSLGLAPPIANEWLYRIKFDWGYNERIKFKAAQLLFDETNPNKLKELILYLPSEIIVGEHQRNIVETIILEILKVYPQLIEGDPASFDEYQKIVEQKNQSISRERMASEAREAQKQFIPVETKSTGFLGAIVGFLMGLLAVFSFFWWLYALVDPNQNAWQPFTVGLASFAAFAWLSMSI